MQWAAVRTQQDLMRIPPQKWLNWWDEPLGLLCRDTCQGWAPGTDFLPPKILPTRLGCGTPHSENRVELGAGVTTGFGVLGTEKRHKKVNTECICES